MKNREWEVLGHVPVDSGQLLLIDPTYLSHWEQKDFEVIRIYQHKVTGDRLQYRVDFDHYQSPIPRYASRNMNDLNKSGEWSLMSVPTPPGLNYNAVCRTTMCEAHGGEVADRGVAFGSGCGDGNYAVKVQRNANGLIMRVLIDFDDDEDCKHGIHSWTDEGKLPPDTECTRCGECYGHPD